MHQESKHVCYPAEDVITGYKCAVILGQSLLADPAHSKLSQIALELTHSLSSAVLSMHLKREDRDPFLILFLTN